METNKEKELEVLKTLVEYNNDRVEGYQKASEEIEHTDLRQLFNKFSAQSRTFSIELNSRIVQLGSVPVEGTTNSGKVYRAWMDVKAALTGKNRKAILGSCEFGEDVALKSYEEAMQEPGLSIETQKLVNEQARHIRSAHDEIKNLRDVSVF